MNMVAGVPSGTLKPMFKTLFRYSRVSSRHANGPLAQERSTFLSHLQTQGVPRSTLLRYASELLLVAGLLPGKGRGQIARSEIARCAGRWARRQRRRGRARTVQWAAQRFDQAACAWCSFMGWLEDTSPPQTGYPSQLGAWASFVQAEGLSESTTHNYCWWIQSFFQWLKQQEVPLRQVTLAVVDGFMRHLSSKPLSRVSLATAAKILRRFAHYAYEQGWWPRDWAPAILSPRLFRQEDLPLGPAWTDVRRLIVANDGTTLLQLRNRAILLLLAVYGLRSGEIRGLRLEDIDWTRRILLVRRSKTARVQEHPLTPATGQAIQRYLRKARPQCARKELFLTCHAPFRRLSAGALYHLTSSLLQRLGVASPKRGPHALRHANATYLLNSGFSLKAVGDHLGHRNLSTTRVYAKVDLVGLRAVAAFDLGGLL
jgi:site-specific recombinase XerD